MQLLLRYLSLSLCFLFVFVLVDYETLWQLHEICT